MRSSQPWVAAAAIVVSLLSASSSQAAESGFSSYSLGSNAFDAGVTPPPGTYVTTVTAYISAEIGGAVPFQGVILNAGAKVDFFVSALNVLYVPERKIFGGNLGLSVSIPVGHINLEADLAVGPLSASREVNGWGLGDIVPRAQLGWTSGAFSHTIWAQVVTPTGRYSPSFAPNIGLHRPGIDTGLAVTYKHEPTKLQFNSAVGVTFNFENTETDYDTGTEFHYEWAVGREVAQGVTLGIVGYSYRQLTGDSGAGATLGPFKGSVDAVGAGLGYATLVGTTPVIFNLRHYQEFNGERRFEGNQTIASGTIRF
jgi:hypothetical protein